MYAFIDRPLASLDPGCRFLVWSMRAWVATIARRQCPAQAIAPAFARWRMIGALQPFHRMMLLFNRDALEEMGFRELDCDRVSEHEAVVVAMVEQLGRRESARVRDTLALLVAQDGVGDTLAAMSALGAAMAVAGISPQAV